MKALSEIPIVSTDVMRSSLAFSEVPQDGKTTTTVGIDYGEWSAPDGHRIGLYGTPGQVRFSSARTSVTAHRSRIVLWIYGQRPDAGFQISRWLVVLGGADEHDRVLIALTRLDGAAPEKAVKVARHSIDPSLHRIPMTTADPRERDDVARVVLQAVGLTPGGNA